MKPRRRTKIGIAPVALSVMVFLLLVLVLYYLSNTDIFGAGKSDPLCGRVISESIILDRDIHCDPDDMGELPHHDGKKFLFLLNSAFADLNCNGHTISGSEGIGVLLDKTSLSGVQNCVFRGFDFAIEADQTVQTTIRNNRGLVNIGGIKINDFAGGLYVEENVFTGTTDSAEYGLSFGAGGGFAIRNNKFSGFRLSGINLYDSERFEVSGNEISNIGDTGIGIFRCSTKEVKFKDVKIVNKSRIEDNIISDVDNVGGLEIMNGSGGLEISKNKITNAKAAMVIYNDEHNTTANSKIIFTNNTVESCYQPISLSDAKNISISGNTFSKNNGGDLITIQNSTGISVQGNNFIFNNAPIKILEGVEKVSIKDNSFQDHFGLFINIVKQPEDLSITANNWGKDITKDRFKDVDIDLFD